MNTLLLLRILFPILLAALFAAWYFQDHEKFRTWTKFVVGGLIAIGTLILFSAQKEEEEEDSDNEDDGPQLSTEKPFAEEQEKGNNEDNNIHEIEYEIQDLSNNDDDSFDDVIDRINDRIRADKNTDWKEP